MNTVHALSRLVENHQILAYGLIFLGLVFEGEITLISAGVLAHLGALNFWVALGFILVGGVVKTLLGYRIGTYIRKNHRRNRFFVYIERRVLSVIPRFRQKPFWSIFVSKFIMGFNYLVIIFSGYQKIDFKKYLKAEFFATAIWAPLLLSIGYFFSYTALNISREVSRFLLILVLFTITFLIVDRLIIILFELFEYSKNDNDKIE